MSSNNANAVQANAVAKAAEGIVDEREEHLDNMEEELHGQGTQKDRKEMSKDEGYNTEETRLVIMFTDAQNFEATLFDTDVQRDEMSILQAVSNRFMPAGTHRSLYHLRQHVYRQLCNDSASEESHVVGDPYKHEENTMSLAEMSIVHNGWDELSKQLIRKNCEERRSIVDNLNECYGRNVLTTNELIAFIDEFELSAPKAKMTMVQQQQLVPREIRMIIHTTGELREIKSKRRKSMSMKLFTELRYCEVEKLFKWIVGDQIIQFSAKKVRVIVVLCKS